MSSVLNILGIENAGFNLVFVIPVAAVLVAVNLLFKFGARKPEITSKIQAAKKQKISYKQKDEKPNTENKGKTKQEKKTLPSGAKDLEMSSDTIKTKPNKKQAAIDKSPKRSSPSKKQQVVVKSTVVPPNKTKKSEKLSNSLINKEEEGEWQTVVKKKQKQTKPDEIVEPDLPSKSKKSPEKPNKNINKKKTSAIEKEEAKHFVEADLVQLKHPVQNQEDGCSNFTENTPVPSINVSNNGAYAESSEDNTLREKSVPAANVAFHELGDDVWTNTKPQKKNRKKALRE